MLCQKDKKKYMRIQSVVMLCMSNESKEGTNTFLLITFLIFNQFSIWLKFWKAETWRLPTIPSNPIYIEACQRSLKKYIRIQLVVKAMYVEGVERTKRHIID